MSKNRLEAFSDGVLAIIITIMVLEFALPAGDTFRDFWTLAPLLRSYAISYLFIATYWVNHHLTFQHIDRVNTKILWCNIVWLFVMSFIPFVTAWAGKYPSSWAPLVIYFADMLLASITFHVMYYFIAKEHGEKFRLDARSIASLAVYSLATGLCGFCPVAAFVAVTLINVWWIIPYKKRAKPESDPIPEPQD